MQHFRFRDKIETNLNLFFFVYFQGSEFSRSAFGCHENSDPGKKIKKKRFKLVLSPSYYVNVLWSRNVHRRQQPESIETFILSAGFIAVASRGSI